MKNILILLLLIPNLSWGLTFKNGKQVDKEDLVSSESLVSSTNQNKSVLIPNEFFNKIQSTSNEEKEKICGFDKFGISWSIINQDLAPKIEGYNSRMDNEFSVVGARVSRQVYENYGVAATYAFVTQDEEIKEKLFDKLYQWANNEALLGTKNCYYRMHGKKIKRECENNWSDPNGQDPAPTKDSSLAIEIAIGLNYIYDILFDDSYLINDPRHITIKNYFAKWHKRVPYTEHFFWGLQMNHSVMNILIEQQANKNYDNKIKSMVKGSNRWMLKDGSMKNSTTRGNRALWYHFTSLAEAMLAMEIAKANNIELPKDYEEKFLNAVDLFYNAYNDRSVITPWAKKAYQGQFDKTMPDYQDFPNLNRITYNSWWMWAFQYRYPNHDLTKLFKDTLSTRARSLRGDLSYGIGLGCIYAIVTESK